MGLAGDGEAGHGSVGPVDEDLAVRGAHADGGDHGAVGDDPVDGDAEPDLEPAGEEFGVGVLRLASTAAEVMVSGAWSSAAASIERQG